MRKLTRRAFLRAGGAAATAGVVWPAGRPLAEDAGVCDKTDSGQRRGGYPFELGIASYTLREFSLDAALAMTRRVGIGRICLKDVHLPLTSSPAGITAVVAKVREAGCVPYACGVVYMTNPGEVERAFAYAKTAAFEVIIGVPNYDLLPLAERKVKETGIRLAIHNHGPDNPLYAGPKTAYDLVKNLDARVGLCLDVGHCQRLGLDPSEAVESFKDRLLDIHLKDVTAATKEGGPVEVGRGVIDIPRLLGTLVKCGYHGTASFEFEKDGKDPLPGLAESVGYVRGVLASRTSG